MNPKVDPQVIADAYAADEAAAAAEYGAEFRRDIESFISREAVDAVVIPGRHELPTIAGVEYVAFVDPSGGAQDAMTLAIAHEEDGRAVLDCVRERRAPFNPSEVVSEFARALQVYGVESVTGDRYAGEWPRERFREHGIAYNTAEKTKSEYYLELLPQVTSGTVELLDHPRLIAQLCNLERRTARGGHDSVDHPPGGHDDVINAVAGVLVRAANGSDGCRFLDLNGPEVGEHPVKDPLMRQIVDALPDMFDLQNDQDGGPMTCGQCQSFNKLAGRCDLQGCLVYKTENACELFEPRADDGLAA
jgi:hypothetical protein